MSTTAGAPGRNVDPDDPQGLRPRDGDGSAADVWPLTQPGPPPVAYADPTTTPWASPPWAGHDAANEPRTIQPYADWTQPEIVYPADEKVLDDGAILASAWQRLLASVIDGVILFAITAVVWIPWYPTLLAGGFSDATDTTFNTTTVLLTLLSLTVRFVYNVGFLTWKQATPGKMIVGLEVRRLAEPRLTVGDVLKRQILDVGATLLSFSSSSAWVITALDPAWLLWDPKRQTLHDRIARTVVVLKGATRLAPRDLR
jgi:uncharacterized RDD family membrane protein YckC